MEMKDALGWWTAGAATLGVAISAYAALVNWRAAVREEESLWSATIEHPGEHHTLALRYLGEDSYAIVSLRVTIPRGVKLRDWGYRNDLQTGYSMVGPVGDWMLEYSGASVSPQTRILWVAYGLSRLPKRLRTRFFITIKVERISATRRRQTIKLKTQEITLSDKTVISAASSHDTSIG